MLGDHIQAANVLISFVQLDAFFAAILAARAVVDAVLFQDALAVLALLVIVVNVAMLWWILF
jgi:hypothetical protein